MLSVRMILLVELECMRDEKQGTKLSEIGFEVVEQTEFRRKKSSRGSSFMCEISIFICSINVKWYEL